MDLFLSGQHRDSSHCSLKEPPSRREAGLSPAGAFLIALALLQPLCSAQAAGESNRTAGTISWSDGAMTRLQNVPSEIRPIARQLIEGMARDQGSGEVDDKLMDLARDTFM